MSLWWILLFLGLLVVGVFFTQSLEQPRAPPRQNESAALEKIARAPTWPERRPGGRVGQVRPTESLHTERVAAPRWKPSAPQRRFSIELIPYPMSGKNARAVLSSDAWRAVRHIIHEEHGWRCNDCLSTEELECHEEWKYDWVTRESRPVPVMQLIGLRSLCRRCHQGKHIKFVEKKQPDQLPAVRRHLMALHGLQDEQLNEKVDEAVAKVKMLRTRIPRELNLTYLNHEKFAPIRAIMGRPFGANELKHCRESEFDS